MRLKPATSQTLCLLLLPLFFSISGVQSLAETSRSKGEKTAVAPAKPKTAPNASSNGKSGKTPSSTKIATSTKNTAVAKTEPKSTKRPVLDNLTPKKTSKSTKVVATPPTPKAAPPVVAAKAKPKALGSAAFVVPTVSDQVGAWPSVLDNVSAYHAKRAIKAAELAAARAKEAAEKAPAKTEPAGSKPETASSGPSGSEIATAAAATVPSAAAAVAVAPTPAPQAEPPAPPKKAGPDANDIARIIEAANTPDPTPIAKATPTPAAAAPALPAIPKAKIIEEVPPAPPTAAEQTPAESNAALAKLTPNTTEKPTEQAQPQEPNSADTEAAIAAAAEAQIRKLGDRLAISAPKAKEVGEIPLADVPAPEPVLPPAPAASVDAVATKMAARPDTAMPTAPAPAPAAVTPAFDSRTVVATAPAAAKPFSAPRPQMAQIKDPTDATIDFSRRNSGGFTRASSTSTSTTASSEDTGSSLLSPRTAGRPILEPVGSVLLRALNDEPRKSMNYDTKGLLADTTASTETAPATPGSSSSKSKPAVTVTPKTETETARPAAVKQPPTPRGTLNPEQIHPMVQVSKVAALSNFLPVPAEEEAPATEPKDKQAAGDDAFGDLLIDSNHMSTADTNTFHFEGNVNLTSSQLVLKSDKLIAKKKSQGGLESVVAQGTVNITIKAGADGRGFTCTSQEAIFDPDTETLRLLGWPKIKEAARTLVANSPETEFLIHTKTGALTSKGAVKAQLK